jgi:hypothetical protein
MSHSFAQVSLLATTLGLAVLGSTLTPAAALPSMHPGSVRLPSLPAQRAPSDVPRTTPTSAHPGSTMIYVARIPKSNLPR